VVSLFEQTERLILLVESRVNRSKLIRIDIVCDDKFLNSLAILSASARLPETA
jgi:hypothetical protein